MNKTHKEVSEVRASKALLLHVVMAFNERSLCRWEREWQFKKKRRRENRKENALVCTHKLWSLLSRQNALFPMTEMALPFRYLCMCVCVCVCVCMRMCVCRRKVSDHVILFENKVKKCTNNPVKFGKRTKARVGTLAMLQLLRYLWSEKRNNKKIWKT